MPGESSRTEPEKVSHPLFGSQRQTPQNHTGQRHERQGTLTFYRLYSGKALTERWERACFLDTWAVDQAVPLGPRSSRLEAVALVATAYGTPRHQRPVWTIGLALAGARRGVVLRLIAGKRPWPGLTEG